MRIKGRHHWLFDSERRTGGPSKEVNRIAIQAIDNCSHKRDIGPVLGFTPKQDQSGTIDKQLHETKAGDKLMRRLLVEGANVIMKENARDTDLKLKGYRICMRGGKISKAKAKIAVARALAVTMTALLMKPDMKYVPLSERAEREFAWLREEEARRQQAKAGKPKMA